MQTNTSDKIRAVLIDDEELALTALGGKLAEYCPDVQVLKTFDNPLEALQQMSGLNADVVFLDIEMPRMNGFTFLQRLEKINFEVIFTTAYSQYAIQALRISALDFLLKPVDVNDLKEAVKRLRARIESRRQLAESHEGNHTLEEQLQVLLQYQQKESHSLGLIALPARDGLEFIDVNEIIKIESDSVYSILYLVNNKKMVITRTLKEMEEMLSPHHFFRVHKSYIINLRFVRKYIRGEGGTVLMSDGSTVEVSRRSKQDFLKLFS